MIDVWALRRSRVGWFALALVFAWQLSRPLARADADAGAAAAAEDPLASPYAPTVRRHFYEQLAKRPGLAFGAELLLPGAGNYYVGFYVPAALTLALSCVGASLWIAGAVRDHEALEWTGMGIFAGARSYGLVSAPLGALVLNAAFRRQFGVRY